jgi:hypothetical protein
MNSAKGTPILHFCSSQFLTFLMLGTILTFFPKALASNLELGFNYPLGYSSLNGGGKKLNILGLLAAGVMTRYWFQESFAARADLDIEIGAAGLSRRRTDLSLEASLLGGRRSEVTFDHMTLTREYPIDVTLLAGITFQHRNLKALYKDGQTRVYEKAPWPLEGDTLGAVIGSGLALPITAQTQFQTLLFYSQSSYIENGAAKVNEYGLKFTLLTAL